MRFQLHSKSILISTLVLAISPATVLAAYSIPADRSVMWQGNAGIPGDIPDRTGTCKTLSPSGVNDTSAIQDAISACPANSVIKLNAGTFLINAPIDLKSGIVLRGSGIGKTILKGLSGATGNHLVGLGTGTGLGTPINLSGGFSKGSTTVVTAIPHGFVAGDIILIDQLNNPGGVPAVTDSGYNEPNCTWCGRRDSAVAGQATRSLGQVSRVVSVPNSTTVALEIPLYWNYNPSLQPQAVKFFNRASNMGLEDLTIDNSVSGTVGQKDYGTVLVVNAANSWIARTEVIGSYSSAIKMYGGYRNTIRDCKVHEGIPNAGEAFPPRDGSSTFSGRAYGLSFYTFNSANLIENNQFYHLGTMIMLAGATSGNVIAYNYFTEPYLSSTTWQPMPISFHGAHPVMNLIEGNFIASGRITSDFAHGSASHNTFFRNRLSLAPNRAGGRYDVDLQAKSQFYNVIGNVIGSPGTETIYELENDTFAWGTAACYRLGYVTDGDQDAGPNTLGYGTYSNDAQVLATLLRHGNYDSVNKSVLSNGSDPVLPASLYLTSKPAWMGAATHFPPIGPDVAPMYPAAPAAGQGTPFGTASEPRVAASAPQNLRVQ